ncbi:MAG: hypothetical protein NVS4B8_18090 [Herpetosiphon sp.]
MHMSLTRRRLVGAATVATSLLLLAACGGNAAAPMSIVTTTAGKSNPVPSATRAADLSTTPAADTNSGAAATNSPINTAAANAEPGTVQAGMALYTAKGCIGCHGVQLQGGTGPRLKGDDSINGFTSTTQLYDYIHRSMPLYAPGSLNDQEVYSLIAFLLDQNGLNKDHKVVNMQTLPTIPVKP